MKKVDSEKLIRKPKKYFTVGDFLKKDSFQGLGVSSNINKPTYLIIHADDIGMCHSVNQATKEAFEKRIVSSGSLMVPCPWFPEAAAYFRRHPEFDVGIHLTFTSEWNFYRWPSIASKEKVPGLVDPYGFLWRSSEEVAQHAKPEEVETEIRAQVERAKQFGIQPTHLDTHMGTLFARLAYAEVYYKVAEEYGIPPLIIKPSPELEQRLRRYVLDNNSRIENLLHILDKMQRRFPALDFLSVGASAGNHEERRSAYHKTLRELKPGVNQIILHLGGEDEEIKAIIGPDAAYRRDDFLIFSEPETREIIKQRGIKVVGWRDLVRH